MKKHFYSQKSSAYLVVFGVSLFLYLLLPFFPIVKTAKAQTTGLVGAYSFNEGSGTSAADASGTNNGGTIAGATWDLNGKYGAALLFDGVNDMVTIADANSLDLTNGMTLEAWVKPTANTSWRTVVLKERPGNLSYALYANSDTNRPRAEIHNPNMQLAVGTSQIANNTWTHVATTYSGSVLRIYVNGNLIASTNTTGNITTSTNPLRIGGNQIWNEFFAGLIDEVRVYNRALTQVEIQTDINTPIAPDTQAPTVAITAPLGGATVSQTVNVDATALDNIAVAGVQFKLDGANLGAEDTTAPYSTSWDTTTATNGSHTLTAQARDAANNTTTSTPVTVTTNNPPKLTMTQPVTGSTFEASSFTILYTKSGDLTEANHAHFRLDGGVTRMDMDFDGSYIYTDVSPGAHTLVGILARANHSEIVGSDHTINFTTTAPDLTPPTVSITYPANTATVSGTFNVTANAADNNQVLGVQFKLDGANLGAEDTTAPYAISWNTTSVTNGSHTLTAQARDQANNYTTSAPITVTVDNVDPRSQVGEWGAKMNWPIVAVHTTLMPGGKVLIWDAWETISTAAKVWDPTTNTFSNATLADQIFCAAHSMLADGKILVIGGHNGGDTGVDSTNVFNPQTNTWTVLTKMQYARWYPSSTTLADGRVVTISGQITSGVWADTPEIYNPATNAWSTLAVNTGSMHDTEYPLAFLLPNGKIYVIAATPGTMHTLDVASQTWTNNGTIATRRGTAAMYALGKILYTGGGNSFTGSPSSTNAYVIDQTLPSPAWRQITSMAYPRYDHNLTVLPNGKVLAVGGADIVSQEATTGIKAAELFDPVAETWTTMASAQDIRNYHSTSVLLPDARVLVAGGGQVGAATNYLTAEIYSPPYLFQGTRPTISTAPTALSYSEQFVVETPDAAAITKITLIPLGTVTHTLDMSQRYLSLGFSLNGSVLSATSPADGNVAPPGYYMLFIVNAQGVPSQAKILRVGDATPPTVSVTAPANNATVLGTVAVAADAFDPAGVKDVQFLVDNNAIGSLDTTAPYSVQWDTTTIANGSHALTARATDTSGNVATSAPVTVTVNNPQDTTPPVISTVQSTNLTTTTATISWTTNENADSQVEYGLSTSYGSSTTLNPMLLTNHSQQLTSLTPGTLYHYRVKSKDASNNLATSGDFTFTTPVSALLTITFDDKAGQDQALNGQYPTNVIDWGTNIWYHSAPWGQFTTKSISFNGGGQTSGSFTFITPKQINSIKAFNGGSVASTVTLSCAGQTDKQVIVPVNTLMTITTGWSGNCTTVTVQSTNGWNTNFDDLVIQ